ncbi:hypothetical protein HNP31_000337 [Acinetobacter johnsonii]|nr:DUF4256 domain-containing protein [Acinetobacter johnsonii]MBB4808651.1 hypothetical protein [Acinetobacter johnsonii]
MIKQQKKLEPEQSENLFNTLEQRFQQHTERHMQISWAFVREKLLQSPEKLYALQQMEMSGGEPDVVFLPNTQDVYFFDCSIESPKGRRSMCYDREALLSRKDHLPENTVLDWVQAYGLSLVTEQQYYILQQIFNFDLKTSSWVKTPAELRQQGGAIFCDQRYGRTFTYHNGAASYYVSRGFRTYIQL